MKTSFSIVSFFFVVGVSCFTLGQEQTAGEQTAVQSYKVAPCYFIPNRVNHKTGKRLIDDPQVTAFVQSQKGRVLFTPSGAYMGVTVPVDEPPKPGTLNLNKQMVSSAVQTRTVVLKTGFSRAQANKRSMVPRLEEVTSGTVHFLSGPKEQWRTHVPTYRKLVYDRVWDGIDLEYLGYMDRLEFRLKLEAGSDPAQIVMETGGKDLQVLEDGRLVVSLAGAELIWSAPFAYQNINRQRIAVAVEYRLLSGGTLGFKLGDYDASFPLVIDPFISWSTFLGGTGNVTDAGQNIAVDSADHVYVTGITESSGFPTTSGAYDLIHNGNRDVFVSKLSGDGSELLYSTFLGGSNDDIATGLALDSSGKIYVAGTTKSSDYPTTIGAYSELYNGGDSDVFVSVLNSDGSDLIYSTFLGGASSDEARWLALDDSGSAYVTGSTNGSDYPTTTGAYDVSYNGGSYDVFVTKLSSDGRELLYSTFIGSTGWDIGSGIAVDTDGNAYVTGWTDRSSFPITVGAYDPFYNGTYDAFVTKLSHDGSALHYSTFLGGWAFDVGMRIGVDTDGNAYVAGWTQSSGFPTTADAYDNIYNGNKDVYVSKLSRDGSQLLYSSFFGGTDDELLNAIAVDERQSVHVTGYTQSSGYPTTSDAYDETHNGGQDVFVSVLNLNDGNSELSYSTFIGGMFNEAGSGIAFDSSGNSYVTGYTESSDYPSTSGAYDDTHNGAADVFVTKIVLSVPDQPGTISGAYHVCGGDTGEVYSISDILEATNYTWTVPPDATITAGQGTTAITVDFGFVSGDVTVTAENVNGDSEPQILSVTVHNQFFTWVTPQAAAQGLDPLIFTVYDACGIGALSYNWTNLTTGDTYTVNPLELPVVSQNTDLELVVTDQNMAESANHIRVLCHASNILDLDEDGYNTIKDLWMLCPNWLQDYPDDPSGDGVIDVRDFLFINMDDPVPAAP